MATEQNGRSRVRAAKNRSATEARLLKATRELLDRDGVLAGLNLNEVAQVAGVNRGLIYQYFGSRKALLRAALADMHWRQDPTFSESTQHGPYASERREVFEAAVRNRSFIRLEAMLSLDGDDSLQLFPTLERSLNRITAAKSSGHVAEDIDPLALHVLTASVYLGYCVFRSQIAAESSADAADLDQKVAELLERMIDATGSE